MSQADLLQQILSGQNRQLQVLAASGLVPLPPEELIPLQVGLTRSPDAEIADNAARTLVGMDPRLAADYLTEYAGEPELSYFALNVQHPTIIGAILRRRDTPRQVFVQIAAVLPPDLQENLILRQDAIIEEPQILVALEKNPNLTNYAKRRIWEYREHLLPRDKVPPKSAAEIEAEAEATTEEELVEAIEEKTGEAPKMTDDGKLDVNQLTDAQVRALTVPMKIKVARGAPKQVRAVLVRDKNVQVATTVITGNNLPDNEVEHIANNRQVCKEVLAEIAKKREWARKYSIIRALIKNPNTYAPTALKFLPRMQLRDLKDLAKDKNVPEAVRQTARRMYNAKKSH